MSTVHLLNAAVMPAPDGTYSSRTATADEIASIVARARKDGNLKTYIGYGETAAILSDLCGFYIETNRSETVLNGGDLLLIAKLNYRVSDPAKKKTIKPTLDDFEFRVVEYEEIPF